MIAKAKPNPMPPDATMVKVPEMVSVTILILRSVPVKVTVMPEGMTTEQEPEGMNPPDHVAALSNAPD